jgi:hypothetical protein
MMKITEQLKLLILYAIALRLFECFTNILDFLVYFTNVWVIQTYDVDSTTIDTCLIERDLEGGSRDVFEERRYMFGGLKKNTRVQSSRCVCLYSKQASP